MVGDEPWVTIESQSGRPITSMLDAPGERVVASVLFSDIVDSTSTLASVGDSRWRDMLLTHNRVMREQLHVYRGREIRPPVTGSSPSSTPRRARSDVVPP